MNRRKRKAVAVAGVGLGILALAAAAIVLRSRAVDEWRKYKRSREHLNPAVRSDPRRAENTCVRNLKGIYGLALEYSRVFGHFPIAEGEDPMDIVSDLGNKRFRAWSDAIKMVRRGAR